jgi:hypothetical protein
MSDTPPTVTQALGMFARLHRELVAEKQETGRTASDHELVPVPAGWLRTAHEALERHGAGSGS